MNLLKTSAKPFVKITPLTVQLRPSRFHFIGFIILCVLLFMAILSSRLIELSIFFLPLFLYYIYNHTQHHFGNKRISSLTQQAEGLWTLGVSQNYVLLPSSSIRRYWAVLYFKHHDASWWKRAKIIAVFPDSLEKEEFRKLRVRLRAHHDAPLRKTKPRS